MRNRSGGIFAALLLLAAPFAAAQSPEQLLQKTYDELLKKGPKYKKITFELTSGNQLDPGWVLQTPGYWGQSAKELPYFPFQTGSDQDPDLGLPYCASDLDCTARRPKARCVALQALADTGKKVCVGHSDELVDTLYQTLIQAEKTIDILTLQRDDDRFRGALTLAFRRLARSGRQVTIRYLVGVPPELQEKADGKLLLDHLVEKIQNVPNSKVTMFQARMLYQMDPKAREHLKKVLRAVGLKDWAYLVDLGSWNHSKIIAVDGRISIVGGHNLWTEDYLGSSYPVNDLSMRLRGPAAADAHNFANHLWALVCSKPELKETSRKAVLGKDVTPEKGCQAKVTPPGSPPAGHTPVLAVGNLGFWDGVAYLNDAAQASVFARSFLMNKAEKSIKISQQEIATRVPPDNPKGVIIWPQYLMADLGKALVKRVDVYIVLGGDAKGEHSGYSHGIPIRDVGLAIREAVRKTKGAPSGPALSKLLCEKLHLANLRFSQDKEWEGPPNERWIKNHAKMWSVDDQIFYIGADNAYPAGLQEFGYIVGGKAETSTLMDEYWNPLWKWSEATAVSGSLANPCMFNTLKDATEEGTSAGPPSN